MFSGKKVSVIEESTIEESFMDYTIEDANPVEDASPRVIVQRLPSATTQPLICAVLAGRGRSETSQIYTEIEEIPDDIRDSVSKYYSKRSSLSTKELLSDVQVAYLRWCLSIAKKGVPAREEAM